MDVLESALRCGDAWESEAAWRLEGLGSSTPTREMSSTDEEAWSERPVRRYQARVRADD